MQVLMQVKVPQPPVILHERETRMQERLRDWAIWFQANATRAPIFYGTDVLAARWAFLTTMAQGYMELTRYALERIADLSWTRTEVHVPAELGAELDALITWYNVNVGTIRDHDRRWEFLLRLQGKFLVLLHHITQDLDRLQQETVLTALGEKEGIVIRAEATYGPD
jgi:hypothetical protein